MAAIQDLVLTFCPTMHSVQQKKLKLLMLVLPTSQPSEDARLVRRQHYRAVRKYCVGGKNLE